MSCAQVIVPVCKRRTYRFDPVLFPDVELPDELLPPELDAEPEFPLPEFLLDFEPERFV
jgi:hypothetical protein